MKHCQTNTLQFGVVKKMVQTDGLGVSECVRGPLPYSVWGLWSFCIPLTPDLQPPESPLPHISCPTSAPSTGFCYYWAHHQISTSTCNVYQFLILFHSPLYLCFLSVHLVCSDSVPINLDRDLKIERWIDQILFDLTLVLLLTWESL